MRKLLAPLFAVIFLATAARADNTGIDLSGTAPGTVTTAVGYTSSTAIGVFTTCSFAARVQGVTGGTLDIYIQTFLKTAGATPGIWVDVAHLPQLAAAAPLAAYAFTLTRFSPSTSAITATLNTADGTPLLVANTVVPGLLGHLLRTVYKTGAGTTVGAAQVITAFCSGT